MLMILLCRDPGCLQYQMGSLGGVKVAPWIPMTMAASHTRL